MVWNPPIPTLAIVAKPQQGLSESLVDKNQSGSRGLDPLRSALTCGDIQERRGLRRGVFLRESVTTAQLST